MSVDRSRRQERLVLFVCSGNVCRSPMAEHLLNAMLPASSSWRAISAGTLAFPGMPATPEAMAVLRTLEIDMAGHVSQPLTRRLVAAAEIVVAMTQSHRAAVLAMDPAAAGKLFLLGRFGIEGGAAEIDDPLGGGIGTYRRCRDEIMTCLPGLVAFMMALER